MKNRTHILGEQAGFTLIESLIALVILTLGILGVNAMQIGAINTNIGANKVTQTTSWATERMEVLLNLPYDDPKLADTNGNGTGEDLNLDGIDDNGGNFGLDDEGANSDFTQVSPDKMFTINWNVAIDKPMAGSKTITVLVARPLEGRMRNSVITFVKTADEKAKGSV